MTLLGSSRAGPHARGLLPYLSCLYYLISPPPASFQIDAFAAEAVFEYCVLGSLKMAEKSLVSA